MWGGWCGEGATVSSHLLEGVTTTMTCRHVTGWVMMVGGRVGPPQRAHAHTKGVMDEKRGRECAVMWGVGREGYIPLGPSVPFSESCHELERESASRGAGGLPC